MIKKGLFTALMCAATISVYGCSGASESPAPVETEVTTETTIEATTETTKADEVTVGTIEETTEAADSEESTEELTEAAGETSDATGIVIDATMNSLTVQIAGKGVFSFATSNAEERELSEGLLIGSPVTLTYTGELEDAVVTKLADSQEKPALSSDRLMFAADIITAVQGRDLARLASLASYPLYVGLGDGQTVASAEELEAMDSEEVFTEQLVKSVMTADLLAAEEVKAGVVLGDGSGFNNTFAAGETGILGITGINYK